MILIVVASVVGILSIFATWSQRQVLETDSWVETSTELLDNEEIRDALSAYLVAQLYSAVDVEAEIGALLPEQAKPLAAPVAGAIRQAAGEAARRALAREEIHALWEAANRAAHGKLIAIVEGGGDDVSTEGGVVSLDLAAILGQVAADVGLPDGVAAKLPPGAAQLEILRSDELEAAQTGADLLKAVAWFLLALTIGLYALAVYLAHGRRRETLRSVGIAFIAVGVLISLARDGSGDLVVESLTSNPTAEPAADAVWAIGTSLLEEAASAAILYGILIVAATVLAGPSRIATTIRETLAPYLREPRYAFGGLAALLVLFFWWNPTPATERLLPSLILIAFAALGLEALRRQTRTEFPDAVIPHTPAGMAQTMATETREANERRTGTGTD